MHQASKIFALAGLFVAAAACGGGGSTAGTGGSTTTAHGGSTNSSAATGTGGGNPAMACADFAHAFCQQIDKCSLNGYVNKLTYGDESTCENRETSICLGFLSAKGTGQAPAKLEMCVGTYANYSCPDFRDNNPSTVCQVMGTLGPGMTCGANGQCSSGYCNVGASQVCGTCEAVPLAGAMCNVQADCGHNLGCAIPTGSATGTCAPFVASGGACLTGSAPCQATFACVGDNEAMHTMGKCQPQGAKVGDACDSFRQTAANCDGYKGLICVPAKVGSGVGTCQAITLVGTGAVCGLMGSMPITGFAACQSGGACIKAAMNDPTGKCVAPAADGAACDTDITKGPPCQTGSRCVPSAPMSTAGTCKPVDATTCM
jgi:hypothetical protein